MKYLSYALLSAFFLLTSCPDGNDSSNDSQQRKDMRKFVIELSKKAKEVNSDFLVVAQDGPELITRNGKPDGPLHRAYLNAIDGQGQEELFFTTDDNGADEPTPEETTKWYISFLDIEKQQGKPILITDYATQRANVDKSYQGVNELGYVGFVSDNTNLINFPSYPSPIFSENNRDISSLSDAKNFLYLINMEKYPGDREKFFRKIEDTNYDLIITDAFFNGGHEPFNDHEVNRMKTKKNGGKRLVFAYMSIGEAEEYRYYWKKNEWEPGNPEWIIKENPCWKENYLINYWNEDWQNIIMGTANSYLQKIVNAGFDGVYLDKVDSYECFENPDCLNQTTCPD